MANIKTTIPIKPIRYGVAVLSSALAVFAAINLLFTMTPVAKGNALIDARFEKSQAIPTDQRLTLFSQIRDDQAHNLAQSPSDPYGWARLSYLRLITLNDQKAAFAALAMSDFVSPYEAPELPERAVMWYRYRNVENKEQQAYQDVLWKKAYRQERDLTRKIAVQSNLVQEIGESLKKTDPALYGDWSEHVSELH